MGGTQWHGDRQRRTGIRAIGRWQCKATTGETCSDSALAAQWQVHCSPGGMHPPQVVAADTPDIVGSWYVIRSTLIAPTPGVSPLTRWTMIFMANGTVIAQVAPVGFTPTGMTTVASIASGVWGQLVTAGTFGFTHLHVRYDPQSGQAFGLSKWLGSITLDPGGETFAIAYRVDVLNPDTLAMESEGEPLIGKGMRIGLDPSLQQVPGQALQ